MNATLKNILHGVAALSVVIPGAPDKSNYTIRPDPAEDLRNMRKDVKNIAGDLNRAVESAKEVFYVR